VIPSVPIMVSVISSPTPSLVETSRWVMFLPTAHTDYDTCRRSPLNVGAVVGVVLGIVAFIVFWVGILYVLPRWRSHRIWSWYQARFQTVTLGGSKTSSPPPLNPMGSTGRIMDTREHDNSFQYRAEKVLPLLPVSEGRQQTDFRVLDVKITEASIPTTPIYPAPTARASLLPSSVHSTSPSTLYFDDRFSFSFLSQAHGGGPAIASEEDFTAYVDSSRRSSAPYPSFPATSPLTRALTTHHPTTVPFRF
jgi:hypothetical protein